MEIEREITNSLSVENRFWKRQWNYRRTDRNERILHLVEQNHCGEQALKETLELHYDSTERMNYSTL